MMKYKHSLQLYKVYNDKSQSDDWLEKTVGKTSTGVN